MKINKWWNKRLFFQQGEENPNLSKINSIEAMKQKKQAERKLFEKIQRRNFSQTPVFALIISGIIFMNFLIFVSSVTNFLNLGDLDRSYLTLFFGANHTSSIIQGKQFWRIISFSFIENSIGFNAIFSLVIVWITYWRIGYYQEIFLGSKKTALISLGGVMIVGISQFLLTKTEALFFYGTEYFTLLALGSLAFHYLANLAKDDKAKGLIWRMMWQTALLIVLFGIFKYVNGYNQIENKALLEISSYYLIYPFLAFLVGFFLNMLLHYKKVVEKNSFAIYVAIGFFVILLIAWAVIAYQLWNTWELGEGTWKKIQPFY